MELTPYLFFRGNCGEAFEFYARCLGGKVDMRLTFGESPAASQVPPEWRDKIIHTRMTVGSFALMGADAPPGLQEPPAGFSVSLTLDSPIEARRVFDALADKGTVRAPLGKTFFSECFGMVTDRFGIPWTIVAQPPA